MRPARAGPPLFEDEAAVGVAFYDSLVLPDVPASRSFAMRRAVVQGHRPGLVWLAGSCDQYSAHPRDLRSRPKGSSKTSYSAALMLVAVLMNVRPRAEFLLVAPSQAIADLAFSQIVGMIEADETLLKRFHPRDHIKQIDDRTNGARLKNQDVRPQDPDGTQAGRRADRRAALLGKEARLRR